MAQCNNIASVIANAKIVMADTDENLILAWYGGHGIHVYDPCSCEEVAFWNTGDFARREATEDEVRRSMAGRIKSKDYP